MKSQFSRAVRIVLMSLSLIATGSVCAQQAAEKTVIQNSSVGRDGPGIAWEQLSAQQKEVLAKAQGTWNQLPPGRQVALANGAKRFLEMNNTQRTAANQRFADWRKLSDGERAAIGERYRLFNGLSPREKQRLRQAARRFDRMNQQDREQMRRQFQDLTAEQRAKIREQLRERQPARRR